ncbi:sensor histidine kinase [Neobacillus sp. OS1-32]|uniref:histidine kinase n=1 Tax=Neobacillus paridis TaxID=2803862 RepID=A0ABS1TW43_9BACI|nr:MULTISPECIES: sensor histidine kinase [Neobacillus]MBL4954778.1 sensor histidine kinase [Neobacillus paridis]WML28977.1 sensor histidine kinase [Neobacillus sp. OS1-32]
MSDKKRILELCQQYTNLTNDDIEKILKMADVVDIMVDFLECDIFIDVPTTRKDESIVVYHCKPKGKSMYWDTPVGEMAKRENEPGVWHVMSTGEHTSNIKAQTQENRYVTQDIYPICNEQKVIGTLIMEKDISDDIEKNFKLNDQRQELLPSTLLSIKSLNDYLDDAILIFDKDGFLQFKNVKAEILYKSLGFMDEIEGKHYDDLTINEITFEQLLVDEGLNFNHEVKIGDYYFLMKKVVVPNSEEKIAVVLRDITQIKDKDAELTLKAVAIREIHHRIKNNLQTIASLLRMQSRRSNNAEAKRLLKDSMNRILSIAATHELLSKQLSDAINLNQVIQFVLNNLHQSYSDNNKISLHYVSNEDFMINSDHATVIALIINELVQNCYDHAFGENNEGTIQVKVHKENSKINISVIDDGAGFDFSNEVKNSLGFSIVQSYVKDKLKGTLQFNRLEKGTDISFQFELQNE